MARELIIYCDESDDRGRYYSNFYGGLLVESGALPRVRRSLEDTKSRLGITGEIKWASINESLKERYVALVDELFASVRCGDVKIRVMFTQNRNIPVLTADQRRTSYVRLYYQFIKHAFGLRFAGDPSHTTRVRLLLDQLPANREHVAQFRGYLAALSNNPDFRKAGIEFAAERIEEIDSKKHILAQCLDVVLGSMSFRLNDKHMEKPPGQRVRGKRTRSKERVYKAINRHVRDIYPGFNIGVSTGQKYGQSDRWDHPYRHWLFEPRNSVRDPDLTKKRKPRDRYG